MVRRKSFSVGGAALTHGYDLKPLRGGEDQFEGVEELKRHA